MIKMIYTMENMFSVLFLTARKKMNKNSFIDKHHSKPWEMCPLLRFVFHVLQRGRICVSSGLLA